MLDLVETTVDAAGEEHSPAAVTTKLKGIAVCGSNPHTKRDAPFADAGFRIYACSPDNSPYGLNPQNCSVLPRVDAWFEIHDPVFDRSRPYAYLDWLRTQPRVYMRDRVAMGLRDANGTPIFPTAVLYPWEPLKKRFGPFTWTSSIAFMMAMAIIDIERARAKDLTVEKPEIGLYGILQLGKAEYEKQRQGTQNMIWEATKARIKVRVDERSGLFEPPPEDF
jgi:hypothetical protein